MLFSSLPISCYLDRYVCVENFLKKIKKIWSDIPQGFAPCWLHVCSAGYVHSPDTHTLGKLIVRKYKYEGHLLHGTVPSKEHLLRAYTELSTEPLKLQNMKMIMVWKSQNQVRLKKNYFTIIHTF